MTRWKVAIDAGHGGHDNGSETLELKEKDLTLEIALGIEKHLKLISTDIDVLMVRKEDIFIKPEERARIASDGFSDFLVSVHINSTPEATKASGYETLINSSLNNFHFLYQAYHNQIMNFLKTINIRDRGVKQNDKLILLREFGSLCLLTENLFIDHPEDAALLKDKKFKDQLSQAHANAIVDFFERRAQID
ncbi:hypothetical protein COJ00_27170 [Priestia megaterium]|uniref:N-acetylmuramoyl-L-alanine amidase family protein n=1 Tax=Priestia megaterium TaxID=1404 RepID=UPI000BFA9E37|nr:N-acetylmuramoyl-L-alanine amidase [Priestia megaterium]PFJ40213.1 hypothetical protein COJ00_27170 [Priestia megaterium]